MSGHLSDDVRTSLDISRTSGCLDNTHENANIRARMSGHHAKPLAIAEEVRTCRGVEVSRCRGKQRKTRYFTDLYVILAPDGCGCDASHGDAA